MRVLNIVGKGTLYAGVLLLSGPALGIAAQRYLKQFLSAEGVSPKSPKEKQRYQKKVRAAVSRLQAKQLIRLVETEEGVEIRVTPKGRELIRRTELEGSVRIIKQSWDKKWRIVLFDIPETKRVARDALRELLTSAGFYQLQKSVFVGPYPCEKQVSALADYFEIGDYVTCAEASRIGRQEQKVRRHFGLE
jgi:DNA-binding transcriptional regulator PaaX